MIGNVAVDKEHFVKELTAIQEQLTKARVSESPEEAIEHIEKAEEYLAEFLTMAKQ